MIPTYVVTPGTKNGHRILVAADKAAMDAYAVVRKRLWVDEPACAAISFRIFIHHWRILTI